MPQFGLFMAVFYTLLFGLLLCFKDNAIAAPALAIATIVAGLWLVRPGWNLLPRRISARMPLLFAAIVASALVAAMGLVILGIATPYDKLQLDIAAVLPLILGISGVEELLFRQIAYRWLEQRQLPQHIIVVATALAWACAHLGGALMPGYAIFVLLQSLYLIWVGVLLGELRRHSGSWLLAWVGHAAYNTGFLYLFGLIR